MGDVIKLITCESGDWQILEVNGTVWAKILIVELKKNVSRMKRWKKDVRQ